MEQHQSAQKESETDYNTNKFVYGFLSQFRGEGFKSSDLKLYWSTYIIVGGSSPKFGQIQKATGVSYQMIYYKHFYHVKSGSGANKITRIFSM